MYALYTLFLNFDDNTWKITELPHRSHPPAAMRMMLLIAAMRGWSLKYLAEEMAEVGINQEDYDRILRDSLVCAHQSYCEIKRVSIEQLKSPFHLTDADAAHVQDLRQRMYVIQPELEQYARCRGLPHLRRGRSRRQPACAPTAPGLDNDEARRLLARIHQLICAEPTVLANFSTSVIGAIRPSTLSLEPES
jgi:hypothetical protein